MSAGSVTGTMFISILGGALGGAGAWILTGSILTGLIAYSFVGVACSLILAIGMDRCNREPDATRGCDWREMAGQTVLISHPSNTDYDVFFADLARQLSPDTRGDRCIRPDIVLVIGAALPEARVADFLDAAVNFRLRCRVPTVMVSPIFPVDDLSATRSVLCDASLRPPCGSYKMAEAVMVAKRNYYAGQHHEKSERVAV